MAKWLYFHLVIITTKYCELEWANLYFAQRVFTAGIIRLSQLSFDAMDSAGIFNDTNVFKSNCNPGSDANGAFYDDDQDTYVARTSWRKEIYITIIIM